jgi:serine/threonine protein kinase
MTASTTVRSRYELREVLNKGGMGVVYHAWDMLMKRDVALKTILDVQNRSAFDLFYKEWGLQASITHPNIIEIYDIGEFEDGGVSRPYFVMPLLPGCSLADLIRNSGQPLPVERTVQIMNQVCRGLQAAHERGLIHRDIKPNNVFVMADDSVKIIDFGVAFADSSSTQTAMRGTLPYMAPELLQLKPPSVLTDIFALGAVCYEALTRRRAFQGSNDGEVSNSILRTNPPPASDVNPAVSLLLSQVVHKAMAKQPWHRYTSAREFGDTLMRAIHNEPIAFFERSRMQPRIERAAKAFERAEYKFATEILDELEGEGYIDPEITMLRRQVEEAGRQTNAKQIVESARRFYEEEEYSLSLRKIQEALELDPTYSDALSLKNEVERNRRTKQVDEWLELGRQHLANHAFEQAQSAIENLLELKPNDPAALEMLAEVNRREQDSGRKRQEKEKLYDGAVEAWEKGEVNAALTRLERWATLDPDLPETDPTRELSCQNFYNRVRTEDEAVRNSLDQARRLLDHRNFAGALEICDRYLAKYPSHALFQALRFDVEEQRRKSLSAFIAETDQRVESEPDLDKRCRMLEEALRAHPDEPHFERSLRLAKDKRNLVNSVVAKAHSQEEQGRFAEALETWEMLRAIYKEYPGLDYEVSRAAKRRDSAARNEARVVWVERIDKLLEAREFEKAAEVAEKARGEFPDDLEIGELERLACKRIATGMEAAGMLQAGRQACLAGKHDEGLGLMRAALELDPGDPVLRATVVDALVDRARSLMDKDAPASEALVAEILDLDPGNASAAGLRRDRENSQRSEFVYWCMAQARKLQTAGDLEGALAVVHEGLATWPQEPGLLQLAATLQHEVNGSRRADPAPSWAGAPPSSAPAIIPAEVLVEAAPPAAYATPPLNPDAGDFSQVRFADTAGAIGVGSPEPPSWASPTPMPGSSTAEGPPPLPPPSMGPTLPHPAAPSPHGPRKHLPMWQWVVLAGVGTITLAFAARYLSTHSFFAVKPVPVATVSLSVSTNPAGAHIVIDGQDRGASSVKLDLPPGTHSVQAMLDGYETAAKQVNLVAHSPLSVPIDLSPLPPVVRITTDADNPDVKLDGQAVAGAAPDFTADRVSAGKHTLVLTSKQGQATVQFELAPATLPVMDGPVQTKNINAVVLSQFGSRAWLYSNDPLPVAIDNGAPLTATPQGIELPSLTAGAHTLSIGAGDSQRNVEFTSGPAPSLVAFVEQKAAPETGGVLVLAGQDGATVSINGKALRHPIKNGQLHVGNLQPGDYTVRVTKDGFESPGDQKVAVKKGEEARLQFQLRPAVRMATLRLQGATAGAEVRIDDNPAGTVQPDGSYTVSLMPGQHTVSLRNGRAQSRPLQRQFVAGQTVQFSAGDLALQAAQGTLRLHISPAGAHVTIRGESEHESAAKAVNQDSLTLAEGTYVVSAAAPDYNPSSKTVTVSAGSPATVEFALTAKAKKAPAPVTGMSHWDDSAGWTQDGEWQVHKGGNFLGFQSEQINGRVEFSALIEKGKKLDWFVSFTDERNFVLFRLDKKNLVAEQFVDGKSHEVAKTPVNFNHEQPVAVRIDVSAGTVNTSIRQGTAWTPTTPVSDASAAFNKGRFGLHIPGKDEVGINGFAYYPK